MVHACTHTTLTNTSSTSPTYQVATRVCHPEEGRARDERKLRSAAASLFEKAKPESPWLPTVSTRSRVLLARALMLCGELLYPLSIIVSVFLPMFALWGCMLVTLVAPVTALHGASEDFSRCVDKVEDEFYRMLFLLACSIGSFVVRRAASLERSPRPGLVHRVVEKLGGAQNHPAPAPGGSA